jgi:hypothetical protein
MKKQGDEADPDHGIDYTRCLLLLSTDEYDTSKEACINSLLVELSTQGLFDDADDGSFAHASNQGQERDPEQEQDVQTGGTPVDLTSDGENERDNDEHANDEHVEGQREHDNGAGNNSNGTVNGSSAGSSTREPQIAAMAWMQTKPKSQPVPWQSSSTKQKQKQQQLGFLAMHFPERGESSSAGASGGSPCTSGDSALGSQQRSRQQSTDDFIRKFPQYHNRKVSKKAVDGYGFLQGKVVAYREELGGDAKSMVPLFEVRYGNGSCELLAKEVLDEIMMESANTALDKFLMKGSAQQGEWPKANQQPTQAAPPDEDRGNSNAASGGSSDPSWTTKRRSTDPPMLEWEKQKLKRQQRRAEQHRQNQLEQEQKSKQKRPTLVASKRSNEHAGNRSGNAKASSRVGAGGCAGTAAKGRGRGQGSMGSMTMRMIMAEMSKLKDDIADGELDPAVQAFQQRQRAKQGQGKTQRGQSPRAKSKEDVLADRRRSEALKLLRMSHAEVIRRKSALMISSKHQLFQTVLDWAPQWLLIDEISNKPNKQRRDQDRRTDGAASGASGEDEIIRACVARWRQRWMDRMPPTPERAPERFDSMGQYCRIFRRLLLDECRAGLTQTLVPAWNQCSRARGRECLFLSAEQKSSNELNMTVKVVASAPEQGTPFCTLALGAYIPTASSSAADGNSMGGNTGCWLQLKDLSHNDVLLLTMPRRLGRKKKKASMHSMYSQESPSSQESPHSSSPRSIASSQLPPLQVLVIVDSDIASLNAMSKIIPSLGKGVGGGKGGSTGGRGRKHICVRMMAPSTSSGASASARLTRQNSNGSSSASITSAAETEATAAWNGLIVLGWADVRNGARWQARKLGNLTTVQREWQSMAVLEAGLLHPSLRDVMLGSIECRTQAKVGAERGDGNNERRDSGAAAKDIITVPPPDAAATASAIKSISPLLEELQSLLKEFKALLKHAKTAERLHQQEQAQEHERKREKERQRQRKQQLKQAKPPCMYGLECFRQNLEHFKEHTHPAAHPRAIATAGYSSNGSAAAWVGNPERKDANKGTMASHQDIASKLRQSGVVLKAPNPNAARGGAGAGGIGSGGSSSSNKKANPEIWHNNAAAKAKTGGKTILSLLDKLRRAVAPAAVNVTKVLVDTGAGKQVRNVSKQLKDEHAAGGSALSSTVRRCDEQAKEAVKTWKLRVEQQNLEDEARQQKAAAESAERKKKRKRARQKAEAEAASSASAGSAAGAVHVISVDASEAAKEIGPSYGNREDKAAMSRPAHLPPKQWSAMQQFFNVPQLNAISLCSHHLTTAHVALGPASCSSSAATKELPPPSRVVLLQGPPGTGKTSTILGIISAVLATADAPSTASSSSSTSSSSSALSSSSSTNPPTSSASSFASSSSLRVKESSKDAADGQPPRQKRPPARQGGKESTSASSTVPKAAASAASIGRGGGSGGNAKDRGGAFASKRRIGSMVVLDDTPLKGRKFQQEQQQKILRNLQKTQPFAQRASGMMSTGSKGRLAAKMNITGTNKSAIQRSMQLTKLGNSSRSSVSSASATSSAHSQPPGSGASAAGTASTTEDQAWSHPQRHILVCAPSNGAVNELLMRMCSKAGLVGADGLLLARDGTVPFVRLGMVPPDSPPELRACCLSAQVDARLARQQDPDQNPNQTQQHQQKDARGGPVDISSIRRELDDVCEKIEKSLPWAKLASSGMGQDMLDMDGTDAAAVAEEAKAMRALQQRKSELGRLLMKSQQRNRNVRQSAQSQRSQIEGRILDQAAVVCCTLSAAATLCTNRALAEAGSRHAFDAVVVDEAAQATEPSTAIALLAAGVRCKAFMLVGDPRQLPATVISTRAQGLGLGRSLFERLERLGQPVSLLSVQHRMHPAIRSFPSAHFYDSKLTDGPGITISTNTSASTPPESEQDEGVDLDTGTEEKQDKGEGGKKRKRASSANKKPLPKYTHTRPYHSNPCFGPMIMYDCDRGSERRAGSSVINEDEARLVVQMLTALAKDHPEAFAAHRTAMATMNSSGGGGGTQMVAAVPRLSKSASLELGVGIVTPYKAQVGEIKRQLRQCSASVTVTVASQGHEQQRQVQLCDCVDVNTVDGFQGREKGVIIFSCVRSSMSSIGFLADARRMNVALTRARFSCWVVGNARALGQNRDWSALLEHARRGTTQAQFVHTRGRGFGELWDGTIEDRSEGGRSSSSAGRRGGSGRRGRDTPPHSILPPPPPPPPRECTREDSIGRANAPDRKRSRVQGGQSHGSEHTWSRTAREGGEGEEGEVEEGEVEEGGLGSGLGGRSARSSGSRQHHRPVIAQEQQGMHTIGHAQQDRQADKHTDKHHRNESSNSRNSSSPNASSSSKRKREHAEQQQQQQQHDQERRRRRRKQHQHQHQHQQPHQHQQTTSGNFQPKTKGKEKEKGKEKSKRPASGGGLLASIVGSLPKHHK